MESDRSDELSQINTSPFNKQDCPSIVRTTSNWQIDNDKNFRECISTISILQVPESTSLEDVVSLDTCIALKSDPSGDSCRVEFKLTNQQRIARIAVVSEASVLEFFKQSGEYATTVFAEFVDDFQDHAVYFAEAKIQPPSSEASIKFTRTKHKGSTMWIYGIKLILTEPATAKSSNSLNCDVINSLISNVNQSKNGKSDFAKKILETFVDSEHNSIVDDMNIYMEQIGRLSKSAKQNNEVNHLNRVADGSECDGSSSYQCQLDELKLYIDNKFTDLEQRLNEKMELINEKINQKLDIILQKLESNSLKE